MEGTDKNLKVRGGSVDGTGLSHEWSRIES